MDREFFRDPYQWIIFFSAAIVSLIVHFAGPKFDMGFTSLWQVLDPSLLSHHLLSSLWNLQMQPPLYNLAIGLLLNCPQVSRRPSLSLCTSSCMP